MAAELRTGRLRLTGPNIDAPGNMYAEVRVLARLLGLTGATIAAPQSGRPDDAGHERKPAMADR